MRHLTLLATALLLAASTTACAGDMKKDTMDDGMMKNEGAHNDGTMKDKPTEAMGDRNMSAKDDPAMETGMKKDTMEKDAMEKSDGMK